MDKIVPAVGILVFKDEDVLLVRHKEISGFLTGVYGLPSGRIEAGEREIDAAIRELEEETGLRSREEELIEYSNNFYRALLERKGGKVIDSTWRVFIAKQFHGELRESEETAPEWVRIADLGQYNLIPNVHRAVQDGLKFLRR